MVCRTSGDDMHERNDAMDRKEIVAAADAYWDAHRDAIVADIAKLVEIPSTEDLAAAAPRAPYGPGPAAALAAALEIAEGMGMSATNCEGHIGFADLPGETDTQLGIIGHMDVVPAGPGWTFEPFKVTEKDGFLMGRGCLDDKGPSVVALHAVKCLAGLDVARPYTIRFLFGANEETSMADVAWYLENYESPAFLFTPDADFPVCYGEKGGYDGCITSAPIADPVILDISGGVVTNAVPGEAWGRRARRCRRAARGRAHYRGRRRRRHGAHRCYGCECPCRLARAWHLRHHAVGELPAGERPVQPARTRVLGTRAKPRVRHHRAPAWASPRPTSTSDRSR